MSTMQCEMLKDLPWLLTAKQVRLVFGLHREELIKLHKSGLLNCHRAGRKRKWFKSELILVCRVPHRISEPAH